jgi:hypothetical protein
MSENVNGGWQDLTIDLEDNCSADQEQKGHRRRGQRAAQVC